VGLAGHATTAIAALGFVAGVIAADGCAQLPNTVNPQLGYCTDGMKNAGETDVDCGGSCGACADGKDCRKDRDCESHVCRSDFLCRILPCDGVCQSPTCNDHVQNGAELAVDCGGTCPSCCQDNLQDNGEAGVDCGGPCDEPCPCSTRGKCIMFVTSISQSGDMHGLKGADATCNSRASIAGLKGRFHAWLCDGVTAPADRSKPKDDEERVPYVRTDGAVIAADWEDLIDGSIANNIDHDEFGNDVATTQPFLPWTNVAPNGTCKNARYPSLLFGPCPAGSSCKMNCADDGGDNGWTSSSRGALGFKGNVNRSSGLWTDSVWGECSEPAERIYCIEH